MKRTTVLLNEGERFGLKALARKLRLPVAAVVRHAVEAYLKNPRARRGRPIGDGAMRYITVLLDDNQADAVMAAAREEGTAMTSIIRDAIASHLQGYRISIQLLRKARKQR